MSITEMIAKRKANEEKAALLDKTLSNLKVNRALNAARAEGEQLGMLKTLDRLGALSQQREMAYRFGGPVELPVIGDSGLAGQYNPNRGPINRYAELNQY